MELILTVSIISIILGVVVAVLVVLYKKQQQYIRNFSDEQELKRKQARQVGVNESAGKYHELLGDFALLSKYDEIITLSSTSKAPSLDLIGVNEDSVDFIEIKKVAPNGKQNDLSKTEKKIRRLIEEKKVTYKVFDVDLPDNFTLEERKLKALKDKPKKV
jgi:predicted Holliday junction resolvase-like endonuclease